MDPAGKHYQADDSALKLHESVIFETVSQLLTCEAQ